MFSPEGRSLLKVKIRSLYFTGYKAKKNKVKPECSEEAKGSRDDGDFQGCTVVLIQFHYYHYEGQLLGCCYGLFYLPKRRSLENLGKSCY